MTQLDLNKRREVLPGYPVEEPFSIPEQLVEYFAGAEIVCLRCGKKYRTLANHLKTIHGMEVDEYKRIYGIPWTYGLCCAETKQIKSDFAKYYLETGIWDKPTAEGARRASSYIHTQKERQPIRGILVQRNLSKMNEGKTGEDAARRKKSTKRGSPEHRELMRRTSKVHAEAFGERSRIYWTGREQTDQHVFNRTGSHKKK